jgi:hypothetical protein
MSNSAPTQPCCLLQPEHLRGLLVHVDAEEVSLRNTMKLLRDLPFHSTDDSMQRELRVRIEQSLQHAAFLLENRRKVLGNLSQYLGIPPEQVCFSALLPYATPAAAALLIPARLRLQKILVQIRTLASTAAWIVNESRRIQLTFLDSLPGSMTSDRYDASGQRNLNPAAFRFETRS